VAERHGNILVVDDEEDVRTLIAAALSEDGHDVVPMASGEEAVPTLAAGEYDVAFIDINLPGMSGFDLLDQHVAGGGRTAIIVITGRATVANAIEATRRGAYDYVTKPFDLDALRLLARQVLERQALQRKLSQAREKTRAEFTPGVEIVGQSAAMQEIYKRIGRVAGTQATVLVQGESGTGKELIAQALHAYSDRWQGPFVAVNCSAIPADLLESEMFGHERGAFTGATERRIGKFEQAAGGTLFLDEIGELPLALQAKLLRVLQEKEFTRVGGHALVPTDCRIVAATNKTLEREVAAGRFREDLYFRLKVVVLDVPPLRERREDIPLLVEFFVDRINALHKFDVRGVSPDALSMLATRAWPGNVRELENVLVRGAALAPNRVLTAADFGVTAEAGEPADDRPLDESVGIKVRQYIRSLGETLPRDLHTRVIALVERPLIEAVLERTGGNQLRAAEALGINRNTLRKRITDLGIDIPKERG
jgi:two-component system nitrogen regulation response regulator GlnG